MILTTGMAHPRKLIRKAVVALLTGATSAGARVHATRVKPLKPNELPTIAVYTPGEQVDQDASEGTAPRELTREVKVEIAGFVAHTEELPVDDAMDDLAHQIEAAMDADRYLGDPETDANLAADTILESTELQVREEDGKSDPLVGIVTLTYSVTYRTSPVAPTDLDDFLTVEATHKPTGGVADTAPAVDRFDVQEPPP